MIVRPSRAPTRRADRGRGRALGLVLAFAATSVLAGCAGASVDPGPLSADLGADLSRGAGDVTISCPSGQPAKTGTTFVCTASTPDGPLVYDVTIESEAGDYRYALAPGQSVDSAALAAELTAQVRGPDPALADATVTCPPAIVAPGGAVDVTCSAVAGSAQLPVAVTGAPGQPLRWAFVTG